MYDAPLKELAEEISEGHTLSASDVSTLTEGLIDGATSAEAKKDVLISLHERGETPDEIASLAAAFRGKAVQPDPAMLELADGAIDYVGTGGDQSRAFNISTAVCFILAAGGVRVMKHGNRGATTPSGTADIQEALGFRWDRPQDELVDLLKQTNFSFFFAQAYHPAFKHIVPVRKELAVEGKRTIFNVMGPLIHPAQPSYQVLGVYASSWVEPIAAVLEKLGRKRGFVIHGQSATGEVVDKAITSGVTEYFGVGNLRGRDGSWTGGTFGFADTPFSDVQSGSPEENATRLMELYHGRDTSGLRDTVLLNAGIGFFVAEQAESIAEGIDHARGLIDRGEVLEWLETTRAAHRA